MPYHLLGTRPLTIPAAAVASQIHCVLEQCEHDAQAPRQYRPPARCDRPPDPAQLLHHRAHRPRQVDARRPDAAAHRRGGGARDAGAVPRPHGHRARARHHHQEPGGTRPVRGGGRQDVHPEPDRHPRPRRLHLRGQPQPGGVRGSGAAGGRRPGHRGPDSREPVPRDGGRPARHPGAEQDRPAGRPAGEVRGRDRAYPRRRPRRRPAGLRQDRRRRRDAPQHHRR